MTTKLSASKPYVVVRLLAHHQQQHSLATLKLQDALTAWINEVNALEPAEYDIEAIRASLARLAATGLFSYAQYRRMMVARGETDARAQGVRDQTYTAVRPLASAHSMPPCISASFASYRTGASHSTAPLVADRHQRPRPTIFSL